MINRSLAILILSLLYLFPVKKNIRGIILLWYLSKIFKYKIISLVYECVQQVVSILSVQLYLNDAHT